MDTIKKRYLELLSNNYKNVAEVTAEIINLQAISNLPKGTELFMSDIHGEYEAFLHILNNGSGIIKSKIEVLYGNTISEEERKNLATLIYYPEEKLDLIKKHISKECAIQSDVQSKELFDKKMAEWYRLTIYRLVEVTRAVSSKYTRSKVRKAMPKSFEYIIDELIHAQGDNEYDKEKYYGQIIESIINLNRADAFIMAISILIKRMAIDHLHIIGDIYDRGPGASIIMDKLMKHHSLDIQWGNHDILWMGACAGNEACICNVVRICSRYDNLPTLEEGYGINIRHLATFANRTYKEDPSKEFLPKGCENSRYTSSDKIVMAKIQKAIAIIQFKVEGKLIKNHSEYYMDDRLILDKVNYKKGTVNLNGKVYELNDKYFPTIDSKNPYELTKEEEEILEKLKNSFMQSEKLQKHVAFLYAKGHMYQKYNGNLLFHGCIPLDDKGNFEEVKILGKWVKGKDLMDQMEEIAHRAYFGKDNQEEIDYMWYLWGGPKSPLFGKDKVATFERYFIDDKAPHKENKNNYYKFHDDENICNMILKHFGADVEEGHIINGHVPVKAKDGESPVRANGKLIVIDGGFAKSYQESTGLAGYTLTYNSHGLVLAANEPFESKNKAIQYGLDIKSQEVLKEDVENRKRVKDTDIGKDLAEQIDGLKILHKAYIDGSLKEKYNT